MREKARESGKIKEEGRLIKMAGKAQWMKRLGGGLAALVMALALVFLADGFSMISLAASGKANSNAKIRKEPSTKSEAVGSASKGSTVEILSKTDTIEGYVWYEVQVDGASKGYIRSDLLDVSDASSIPTQGGGSTTPGGTTTPSGSVELVTPVGASVSGSNTVRVRTSASTTTSNNILTTVNKGTEVTVSGRTTGSDGKTWYQVKLTVNGKEVIGYIRSDYLTLSGEVKPLEADPITPPADDPGPSEGEPSVPDDTTEPKKRYDTKLINEKWYLLDYEAGSQWVIDDIFKAATDYKELYEKADKKAKGRMGWLVFFIILFFAAAGAAAYLIYRIKEYKEEAFIASIENNVPRRTAERPRGDARAGAGRERPAIKDGMESRREEAQRPANGQRTTGNRSLNGQRPVAQASTNGQRPVSGQSQNGQRTAGAQAQGGQRPVNAQSQRPAGGQSQNGQRPVQPQGAQRPMEGRPQGGQGQTVQRPVNAQPQMAQRPVNAQPHSGQAPQGNGMSAGSARPKNVPQESDDMEFEFLNWDSDE